ncbi:unnamed protein product, partial [Porites evermanni]
CHPSQILTNQKRQLTGNASHPSTVRNRTTNPGNANVQVGGNRNSSWGLKCLRHGQTRRSRIQPGSKDDKRTWSYPLLSSHVVWKLLLWT